MRPEDGHLLEDPRLVPGQVVDSLERFTHVRGSSRDFLGRH